MDKSQNLTLTGEFFFLRNPFIDPIGSVIYRDESSLTQNGTVISTSLRLHKHDGMAQLRGDPAVLGRAPSRAWPCRPWPNPHASLNFLIYIFKN